MKSAVSSQRQFLTFSKLILIAFILAVCAPAWAVEVSDLAGLKAELAKDSTEEIVATQTIVVSAGGIVELDGKGRTLRLKSGVTGKHAVYFVFSIPEGKAEMDRFTFDD